ncbi:MAG: MiaB/RimO family radical SAM methylthiotransferase [Spirochaetia bacterium]|nr:MiaB/RimO family radical SAM methylthiotransferase [Spirochaetia bacterium]
MIKTKFDETKTEFVNKKICEKKIENNIFYILTLGCPKNKVDSRKIWNSLTGLGYCETNSIKKANILIINSCGFIKEAQKETIDTIFNAIKWKKTDLKNRKIVLVGCFSQRFEKETKIEIPEVDLIIGTGLYDQVGKIITEKFKKKFNNKKSENNVNTIKKNNKPYAYFRTSQGCSRRCTFCVIPSIRGKFISYDLDNIKKQFIEEKKFRNNDNITEVILVSQDTVSQKIFELEKIISYFSSLDEVKWIRLHYLFPDKRILNIIKLFEKYSKLVSYLDIPFQHISKNILKNMNRPYDSDFFSEIIQKAIEVRKDIEIRTSFILGFPGEENRDIDEILNFLEVNQIHKLSLFSYSHENSFKINKNNMVADHLIKERINLIRNYHLKNRKPHRQKLLGTIQNVIIDNVKLDEVSGRRPQDSPEIDEMVFIKTENLSSIQQGDIIPIELTADMEYDWIGELVKHEPT